MPKPLEHKKSPLSRELTTEKPNKIALAFTTRVAARFAPQGNAICCIYVGDEDAVEECNQANSRDVARRGMNSPAAPKSSEIPVM